MNLLLPIQIPYLQPCISLNDHIYLVGSCFTEHMAGFLQRHKFSCKQNAHGIVFNPISVCQSIKDVIEKKPYTETDIFQLHEYWHSWLHHSNFSYLDKHITLQAINETIIEHHDFLKQAKFVFITLGSAFAYYHLDKEIYVSNNHRAPSQWFRKDLLEIDVIKSNLEQLQKTLLAFNPNIKLVFTVSPVRHARDGVIENNRSKARLLEAIHGLNDVYYFPSYELVIDILRDYRFYDMDLIHPNYQATAFVWEQFKTFCIDSGCYEPMQILDQVYKAKHHKPKDTQSQAHKQFLAQHKEICLNLLAKHPNLNLTDEIDYFSS